MFHRLAGHLAAISGGFAAIADTLHVLPLPQIF